MDKDIIKIDWLEEMAFEGEVNDHKIIIDADSSVGGNDKGPRPKPLLLLSLAGCTGMDVVSLMKKMRVNFDKFQIEIEAVKRNEHPKSYTEIKIIYKIYGNDLPKDKIDKAVNLSKEKYCGVSDMLKKAARIEYEIKIID